MSDDFSKVPGRKHEQPDLAQLRRMQRAIADGVSCDNFRERFGFNRNYALWLIAEKLELASSHDPESGFRASP